LVYIQLNENLIYIFIYFLVVDIGALPTAPRSAVDIDYTTVPTDPPFVAIVSNLSFEIDDEGLRRIFADLNVKKLYDLIGLLYVPLFFFSQEQLE
jgi:hypothetical protein